MKQITITYQPFKLLKYTRLFKGNFPQKFHELSAKQLIAVACLVKGISTDISFLTVMTGIKTRILKKLDEYQLFNLMELFTMFNTIKPFHEFIIKKIEISHSLLQLFAPKPKLKNVTFGQFIFGDTYFSNYQHHPNPDDLHKFVASFYLPAGETFSEKLIEENLPIVKKVDAATLEAIALNYHLLREWLTEVHPLVFIKEDATLNEADGQQPKAGSEKPAANPWIKIFENIVGDDIINHDNYANMPAYTMFRFMTKRIKENMKRKK